MASSTKWVVWKAKRKEDNNPNERKLRELGVCIFQSSTETQARSVQNDGPKEKSSRTIRTKGWWRRGDIHTGTSAKVMQCWVHEDAYTELTCKMDVQQQEPVVNKTVQALKAVWEDNGQRDDLILDLQGPGRHFWAGTEAGLPGAYSFQGIQAGGDGSSHQQRMGAGVWCRHVHNQEWSLRVGRESEGTNSKRPELAALVSALRAVHVKSPLLYLCDNEAVLQDIAKWIGEGHKTSMTLNKDADIMNEIIQRLHARVQEGAATFLLKVKSHRGEALNEMADAAAEHGRGKGEEDAVFTKASERLVLQVERYVVACYSLSVSHCCMLLKCLILLHVAQVSHIVACCSSVSPVELSRKKLIDQGLVVRPQCCHIRALVCLGVEVELVEIPNLYQWKGLT